MQLPLRSLPFPELNFNCQLAPMVGLSHVALRELIRCYLPKNTRTLWPTEMLNSRRLPSENLSKTNETQRTPSESYLVPQLLGNEKDKIINSLKKLEQWGADGIDINMGCPVTKAIKHNYGVSLMGDMNYASHIVEITATNTQLPVSVKLRSGLQKDLIYLKDFCQALEQSGAQWLTLHPRLAKEKRRGNADWSQIRWVKENTKIPIIGNGDIQTAEDIENMFEQTSCDGVMVGRALTARPWLFWQYGYKVNAPHFFKFGRPPQGPEEEAQEYGRSLIKLIELLKPYYKDNLALRRLRFHVKVSHKWLNFGHSLWSQLTTAQTTDEASLTIENFFKSSGLRMSAKTELRE